MTYSLTIVADHDDLSLLQTAASEVPGVELTSPEPLETTGDGLNFPIDPHTAIEGLQIVAATVSTVNGVRQLLATWSMRRGKRLNENQSGIEQQVTISDVTSGDVIYHGHEVDDPAIEEITRRLDRDESEK